MALHQLCLYFPSPSAVSHISNKSPVLNLARVRRSNLAQCWSTQDVSTRAKPARICARVALPFLKRIPQNGILRNVDNVIQAGRGVTTRVVTRVTAQAAEPYNVSTSTEEGTIHSTSHQYTHSRIPIPIPPQYNPTTSPFHSTRSFMQSVPLPPSHPVVGGF